MLVEQLPIVSTRARRCIAAEGLRLLLSDLMHDKDYLAKVQQEKAEMGIRIHRLAEHRRLTPDEAAALLNVPRSDLPALFRGRLATCSLDQLLRMLTWLGDDVEILIRPRLQRTKRGALRVLQAAAVEKPDDFEPVRYAPAKRLPARTEATSRSHAADEENLSFLRSDRAFEKCMENAYSKWRWVHKKLA